MSMAFEDAYCAQKPLPKKEVMKLKPGTWIELRDPTGPNRLVLLLARPKPEPGALPLSVLDIKDNRLGFQLSHPFSSLHYYSDQVVAVHGTLPSLLPVSSLHWDGDRRYELYSVQKSLSTRQVRALTAGTWVELRWMDAPNSMALLLDRPTVEDDDWWLPVLSLCNGTFKLRYDVLAEQVVKTAGKQVFPKTAFKD